MNRLATRSKYGAVRTVVDGISFASKKEAAKYAELKMLQKIGEISGLQLQPRFKFVHNGVECGTYVADFLYVTKAGVSVTMDVKGFKTELYRRNKKMMKAFYGIDILEA
jgi:hypothetical protein